MWEASKWEIQLIIVSITGNRLSGMTLEECGVYGVELYSAVKYIFHHLVTNLVSLWNNGSEIY